ncbi:hypothetical protein H6F51_09310 [Cyanobacteria bacterium FACHB-DQ100]|nr:hypothetical protein [Cyanobacteria bacterium FACHB-DQ100]
MNNTTRKPERSFSLRGDRQARKCDRQLNINDRTASEQSITLTNLIQAFEVLDMNGNTLPKLDFTHPENSVHPGELERLQKEINKLIPISDALVSLIKLRAISIGTPSKVNHKPIGWQLRLGPVRVSIGTPSKPNCRSKSTSDSNYLKSENEADYEPLLNLAAPVNSVCLKQYSNQLNDLWSTPDADDTKVRKQLADLKNKVDLIYQRLNGLFNNSIGPISIREKVIKMYVSKIGHLEFKKEAESNCEIISMLLESISHLLETTEYPPKDSATICTTKLLKLDVLDDNDRANAVIGDMIAIELRRLHVEQLVKKDRRRRTKTLSMVTGYILFIATCIIILPLLTTIFPKLSDISFLGFIKVFNVINSNQPLAEHNIHLLGIPAAVIIWSFIGSFAATIHRFNRKSVYFFDDATKWMITRHVQGIVLSSAFYLILTSGLFLPSSGDNQITGKVILVLSFLIGFSDRFVDSVFNTLIERYSGKSKSSEQKSNLDDRDSE